MIDLETYLTECVKIDRSDLSAEYVRVPADMAFWSEQYAVALQDHGMCTLKKERIYADLFTRYSAEMEGTSGKRPTISAVEARMLNEPHWVEVRKQEIRLKAELARLHGVTDALKAKRDMLISLGATARQEMLQEPRIYGESE